MSSTEMVFASFSALVALAAMAIPLWRSRQRHAVRWVRLRPKSMLDVAEEVAAALEITYEGRPIQNLTQYQFIVHNTGFAPLDRQAISKPLTWHAPGKIVAAWQVASDPPVELSLDFENQRLTIEWELFNQRCKALVKVLCENVPDPGSDCVEGQIRDVPKIEEKGFDWVSEEETAQRIRTNIESQQGLSRTFLRLFATGSGMRTLRTVFSVYLVVAVVGPINAVMYEMNAQTISFVAGNLAVSSIGLLLFLKFRNPYIKLLRRKESGSMYEVPQKSE